VLDVPEAEFDRIFRVNVKSIFHFVHAIVPAMRANGGGSSSTSDRLPAFARGRG
jgi:NAD(P)-dependent dehydrogenase (short-subunit alcohol dehydrogenase family)